MAEIAKLAAETREIDARTLRDNTNGDAERAKINAETEKASSEARRADIEASRMLKDIERAEHEIRSAEYVLREQRVHADEVDRSEKRALADDYHARVYRFTSDIGDKSIEKCMDALSTWSRIEPGCAMEIIILSPGGSVLHGFALYDFLTTLKGNGHRLTIGAQGYAASMAGVLLQAGDVRYMGRNSFMLVHEISNLGLGSKMGEIEDALEFLNKLQTRVLTIFEERSGGLAKAEFLKLRWSRKDWWLDATEAKALGLIDEVR